MDVNELIFIGKLPLSRWQTSILTELKCPHPHLMDKISVPFNWPLIKWLRINDPEEELRFIKELDEQRDEDIVQSVSEKSLPSKAFWNIIDLIDLGADDPLGMAREKLAGMTEKQIRQFEEALAHKLYKLDTEKHAMEIGDPSYVDEETFFSPDFFLYARCLAVARGKTAYEHVLKHPEAMPKDDEFEELLTLASEAFEAKTGEEWDYFPSRDYETFGNERGWE